MVIHGASHSWVLKDPETLPAIVYELLGEGLGAAQRRALLHAGLLPGEASPADVETAFYEQGRPRPAPRPGRGDHRHRRARPPTRRARYRWTVSTP